MSLLTLLALLSCATTSEDSAAAPATPPVDADADGSADVDDCEPSNPAIHPGAPEGCNGLDDNCDGHVDEYFDEDGDGEPSAAACVDGRDCNDADASIYPGATEVLYDAVDQDCDGHDVTDADGDGFDGIAASGDDCDDADPGVHPGHADLQGDGLDADCDGADGGARALADLPVTISGRTTWEDLAGFSIAACDIDEDGVSDLVVSAPLASEYAGQVGIWYGAGVGGWTGDMRVANADTVITSSSTLLGYGVACSDVDGDGHVDLVIGRGDLRYGEWIVESGLVFWYGTGVAWPTAMDEGTASSELTFSLGVDEGIGVYALSFTTLDVDGDGAAEVVLNTHDSSKFENGDSTLRVLPGVRYETSGALDDQVDVQVLLSDPYNSLRSIRPGGDPDGDGKPQVLIGEAYSWTWDGADYHYPGSLKIAEWNSSVDEVEDLSARDLGGEGELEFGWDEAVGDLDGDGVDDLVVSAIADPTTAEDGGGVYLFRDYAEVATTDQANAVAGADAGLFGTTVAGYFGWRVVVTDDVDGDGTRELLASEPRGGPEGAGRVYLLSGALAWAGGDPSAAALLVWEGEDTRGSTGLDIVTADFDGDGKEDWVFPAYCYYPSNTVDVCTGRVYVELSSRW